jgi:hypothetical protein
MHRMVFSIPTHTSQKDGFTAKILSGDPDHSASRYAQLFKNRFDTVEGGFLGLAWTCTAYDFCKHVFLCIGVACKQAPAGEKRKELLHGVKETFVKFVSFSGMSASLMLWANRVRIIALGLFAGVLQKCTYGIYGILSGFGIERSVKAMEMAYSKLCNEKSASAKIVHGHRCRAAFLDVASEVSTLAWAVLGIVGIVAGVALSPLLMDGIFMTSCALAFLSIGYNIYIDFKYESKPPKEKKA